MARNRSHDPIKPTTDFVPLSSYNTLVTNFQLKLQALEKKYQAFVLHCTKIIKDAQAFLDISIHEHLNTSTNQSSKLIETFTKQKAKLKKDLKSIQKMSVDFKNTENSETNQKMLEFFRTGKEKILEKLDEHKSKYFIQTVLMNLEDKVMKELEIFGDFGQYYSKLYEVEELLRKKTKDFEELQESYNKVRIGTEQMHLTERRIGSPSFQIKAGRTSPSNFMTGQNKDQEIKKLKTDINFLQEKIVNLTGTAKKLVAKKDSELQRMLAEKSKNLDFKEKLCGCFAYFDTFQDHVENKLRVLARSVLILSDKLNRLKVWKKLSGFRVNDHDTKKIVSDLEKIVNQLTEELHKKDEKLNIQHEKFTKLNKLYSSLHEKSKIFSVKYENLLNEFNEKSEKYNELASKSAETTAENEKLKLYKSELDREISELKDYFQADIDSLSNKIEKLFGENLCLKQKNEEIREKYERVMGEKEKLLVQIYESKAADLAGKADSGKSVNNSLMALRQELKISGFKVESLVKENFILKSEQKQLAEFMFGKVLAGFSEFFNEFFSGFLRRMAKIEEKVVRIANFKKARLAFVSVGSGGEYIKNKIADLSRSATKQSYLNENLQKKCEYYENLITQLQLTIEKLTSQQDSLYKCSTCESYSRINKEKDNRIKYLQSEIQILSTENNRLNKEIQEIEFTFQNHIQDSKAYEFESPSKHLKKFSNSPDSRRHDVKNMSQSISDVDLTYTIEGTTIKSVNEINTPIEYSNDEIKDLEFIE